MTHQGLQGRSCLTSPKQQTGSLHAACHAAACPLCSHPETQTCAVPSSVAAAVACTDDGSSDDNSDGDLVSDDGALFDAWARPCCAAAAWAVLSNLPGG